MENEFIDFTRFATEQTDKELIRIVTTERDSFHPLAVDAAEKELKERKIDILVHGVKRKEVIAEKIVDSNLVGINLRFINLLIDITVWLLISEMRPCNYRSTSLNALCCSSHSAVSKANFDLWMRQALNLWKPWLNIKIRVFFCAGYLLAKFG